MKITNNTDASAIGCTIRKAIQADIDNIYKIELMCFSEPWDYKNLVEMMELNLASFYVAEIGERIIGFSAGAIENTDCKKYGHICNIAVVPEMRGYGVGNLLMKHMEHDFYLQKCDACSLEVRVSNEMAKNFYKKIGYTEVIVFGNYYPNNEDAVIMMKWF
ncbi:MAG TPA: ribosomal protein S18-alanine N-acetyltransferase [Methanocorpusculum sp.]|nr:ribosomal protein S18-alanine N-acetyltransferase [Methanocorpusculum sp.]